MQNVNTGLIQYYSELEGENPVGQIEATYSASLGKYRIKTPLELKGRGIKYYDTYTESNCLNPNKYGWNIYYVTENTMDKLKHEYLIVQELLLD